MLIRADGICCFHLAGVIGQLSWDPKAVESGKTSCTYPELDVTREQILFNFTRWRDRVRGFCCSEAELEAQVYSAVCSTSKHYLLHAAGLTPGKDLQGLVQDLALYTLFSDIRVVVVIVDMIHANSNEKQLSDACVVAGFEGESEKRRVVCAILEKDHYNLGVVFRPEAQAVFDNGAEWDNARSLILHYLCACKAKPPRSSGLRLLFSGTWMPRLLSSTRFVLLLLHPQPLRPFLHPPVLLFPPVLLLQL